MRTISLVLTVPIFLSMGHADVPTSWIQASGPTGGIVQAVASVNGIVFAGTQYGGIYQSTDSGAHWKSLPAYTTTANVTSLAATRNGIFAGSYGSGVSVSRDDGGTWRMINSGLSNMYVKALLVNGIDLYAATGGGVFRSVDGGEHWSNASTGLLNLNIYSLASDGKRIFAGTFGSGIFVSTNQGGNWNQSNVGITEDNIFGMMALRECMYAGTLGGGVFRSTNGGQSWHAANQGLGCLFISSFVSQGDTLFAGTFDDGVFFSTDDGYNWNSTGVDLSGKNVQTVATSGGILFAGLYMAGVFTSHDGGIRWQEQNTGLCNTTITSILDAGNILLGGSYGGVVRSLDGGRSWVSCGQGITNQYVTSVCTTDRELVAGTLGGVFISRDKGLTWSPANLGLSSTDVLTVISKDSCLYAGTLGSGVFRSSNRGEEWTPFGLDGISVNMLLRDGDSLFAASDEGVFITNVGSDEWRSVEPELAGLGATSIAVNANWIFVGTRDGYVVSLERFPIRGSVLRSHVASGSVMSLLIDGQFVFACVYGSGVFFSATSGASWEAWNDELQNLRVNSLAAWNNSIVAGTAGSGVWFRSNKRARTYWETDKVNQVSDDAGMLSSSLVQNYPNPFNPVTNIRFLVPSNSGGNQFTLLKIYDVLGREVATIVNGLESPGTHSVRWDASNMTSGVYFCKLQLGSFIETKKLILSK